MLTAFFSSSPFPVFPETNSSQHGLTYRFFLSRSLVISGEVCSYSFLEKCLIAKSLISHNGTVKYQKKNNKGKLPGEDQATLVPS